MSDDKKNALDDWEELEKLEEEKREHGELSPESQAIFEKVSNLIDDFLQAQGISKIESQYGFTAFCIENMLSDTQPELDEVLRTDKYNNTSLGEILDYLKDTGEWLIDIELLEDAEEEARKLKDGKIPHITIKRIEKLKYPVDKLNNNVWQLLEEDTRGQLTFATESRGAKKTADIIYSIDFEGLEDAGITITKKLSIFDKYVYIAIGSLYNAGVDNVTIPQICKHLGYETNKRILDKVYDSITKMNIAHIFVDNTGEHKNYPKYPPFVYDGSLLPMERVTAIVNGQRAECVVHLLREPPLFTFSKERKHITSIKRTLLESPISKTEASLLLNDYLIKRISQMKNSKGKISNKLLYSTIFDNTGNSTRQQKSRAKGKINTYLNHYITCDFIKSFKEVKDGIIISY